MKIGRPSRRIRPHHARDHLYLAHRQLTGSDTGGILEASPLPAPLRFHRDPLQLDGGGYQRNPQADSLPLTQLHLLNVKLEAQAGEFEPIWPGREVLRMEVTQPVSLGGAQRGLLLTGEHTHQDGSHRRSLVVPDPPMDPALVLTRIRELGRT